MHEFEEDKLEEFRAGRGGGDDGMEAGEEEVVVLVLDVGGWFMSDLDKLRRISVTKAVDTEEDAGR